MAALRRAVLGVLVLLVAFSACRRREEGPEPGEEGQAAPGTIETQAIAGDLPAGASVVVSVYDLEGFWNRVKGTQLYTQLRAIPQIDSLMNPQTNSRLAEAMQGFQARMGMPLNEQTVFTLLGDKAQFGFYPAAAGGDTTLQRAVIVADMGDKDALASMFANLRTEAEGEGAKYTTEQYKGVDVTIVSDAQGVVRGLYGFHEDKLVAATDQASLQSAIGALDDEGETMADDSLYQLALTKVDDANITVFVNRGGVQGLVGALQRAAADAGEAGIDSAAQQAQLDLMERYNIQSSTIFGANWTDAGLQVTSFASIDPDAQGAAPLREMLETPPSEVEVMSYFPDSTLAFYAVNLLDAPKLYQYAVSYGNDAARLQAGSTGEAAAAPVDSAIAQFERQTGIDVETDILSWMGKEAAFGMTGVVRGGFFPVPEISLLVQTTDPAKSKALMDKVEAQIVQAVQQSGQGFPVQFQQEDYKGVALRFAPTPMGEGLAPGYAIHEDFVLVALSRNTLRRLIDAKTGGVPAVTANAGFQALSGFLPGEANIVGFANTVRLIDEIAAAMGTFQQMSGQAPQNQDTFTAVIAALKNIQSVGVYGTTGDEGIEQKFLVRIQ